ncbi:MAG: AAA family ATPase [Candidatus Limnocylindria bacterium]
MTARTDLPGGTLTFLFTDIEGSTQLARALGTGRWNGVLADHGRILRRAVEGNGGIIVRVEGDSFFAVFTGPAAGVAAAVDAQRAIAAHPWPKDAAVRVRMGLHTGEAQVASADTGADYVGFEVHRAARIAAAPHGGQTVISETTSALVADDLPSRVTVRDMGRHHLKDLRTERLFQLDIAGLASDFPPLRTLDRTPNNLPAQLTTFVGREREMARLAELLRTRRLVTLTGPGGTGKSRLAFQAAADASTDFPDGVFFVPLSAVTEPALVPSAIIASLRLSATGERPLLEILADHLAERSTLLVLDNFEHLTPAATVVTDVLARCSRVKALVTSRAPLMVSGEQEFPVPPLDVPDEGAPRSPEAVCRYEAVRLFVERAVAARPDFAITTENASAVTEICVRLDGLPLAIELAAARVRVLSPKAMLPRLERGLALLADGARDLPARQRTLRGTIAWSYEMLGDDAKRLFATFSVFSGGASLPQAEAVCGAPGGEEVFDGLARLASVSLLRQREAEGEPRFVMLQTIREFAGEQLRSSGGYDAARRRHAEAFRDLAETAAADVLGPRERELLDEFEREHDNLRAALSWSVAAGETATALRLLAGLWRFWQMRGHLHEAQESAGRVLALPWVEADRIARIRGVAAAGGIAYWQAHLEEAGRLYVEALDLARQSGDPALIAETTYDLAFVFTMKRSEPEKAGALLTEAQALYAQVGNSAGVARARFGEAIVLSQMGDWASAERAAHDALVEFRRLRETFLIGWAQSVVGICAVGLGKFGEAREAFAESLRTRAGTRDLSSIAIELYCFGILAKAEGRRERAARLVGAAAALGLASGTAIMPMLYASGDLPLPLEHPADAQEGAAWDAGAAMPLADAIAYALEA